MIRRLRGLLLLLLPGRFRRRHGEDMDRVFEEALGRARRDGRLAVAALAWREARDLVATAARLRDAERTWTATGWAAGLRDDARHAFRSLRRRPGFTAFAALTVALGVGATTAVFSVLESVILNPLPYEGADRIVTLWRALGEAYLTPSEEQVEAWAAQGDLFEDVERFHTRYPNLTGTGEPARVQVGLVEPTFFDFLGVRPLLGRRFTADETAGDGTRVVLLAHHVWKERFGGDPGALGATVTLDGEPWTVIGVLPPRLPMPNGITNRMDLWQPLPASRARAGASVVARLRPGTALEEAQARLDLVAERTVADGGSAFQWNGAVLRTVDMVGGSVKENLRVLMIAVTLLLLISCVNVSNLLLSRAGARRHETAVRAALGAGRARLARELLFESLALAGLGGLLGVAIALGAVEGLTSLRGDALDFLGIVHLDGRVLAFAVGLTLASGVGFGVLPALRHARAGVEGLGAGHRTDTPGGEGRSRWVLVGAEVALSFALLVGAMLLLGSLAELRSRDPGLRAEGLVAVRVSLPTWQFEDDAGWKPVHGRIAASVARLPDVEAVVETSGTIPSGGIFVGTLEVEGEEPEEGMRMFHGMSLAPGYFDVAAQRLLAGRDFTPDEVRDDAPVAVVGEAAARRMFPGQPPADVVGKRFKHGGDEWLTVVGVAADVSHRGLGQPKPELQMYRPLDFDGGWLLARTTPGSTDRVLGAIRREVRGASPDAVILELAHVADMLRATLGRERFTGALLSAFALLALVLSAVGLYGVVSQVVGHRTREIGIRISLGARRTEVGAMILGQGVRATLLGIAAGVALAFAGREVLASRVFGVEPVRPLTYAVASAVLVAVALLACCVPALRAASVDPSEALRTD